MAFSQSLPFKYQAVIHDNEGKVLTNKTVGLRVSILQDTNAVVVYREEFTKTSDEFGIIDLEIGTGSALSGNYLTINWSKQLNQLKVEIDMNGGTTYSLLGTTPILSAPIANYAYKAGSSTFPPGMIMPFAGPVDKVPEGWLLCNGSEVSRTDMAGLFDVIGIAYGGGNQTSTFNLPDFRGMFLRGANNGRTDIYKDPDVANRTSIENGEPEDVGSLQTSNFLQHLHAISINANTQTDGAHGHHFMLGNSNGSEDGITWMTTGAKWETTSNYANIGGTSEINSISGTAGYSGSHAFKVSSSGSTHKHNFTFSGNTANFGGNESRPNNIYVNYIIKY